MIKLLYFFIISILVYESITQLICLHDEDAILSELNSSYEFDDDLHTSVNRLRDYLYTDFLNTTFEQKPRSNIFMTLWLRNRPMIRQTATETIGGHFALCGEISRTMVCLLRNRGIKARRLYVYKDSATNHVLFEYFHEKDEKWYVVDSFKDFLSITDILRDNKLSAKVFTKDHRANVPYDKYSHLNKPITSRLGRYPYDIPYYFSVLMDSPHLLKLTFYIGILFIIFTLKFLIKYLFKTN